jgi:hypothetical protein
MRYSLVAGRFFIERISLRRSFLLRIALPLLFVVVLPAASQAQQWGFSDAPRRSIKNPPSQPSINTASQPTVVVDKNSGRYLQSVGKRVVDRPLACPPKRGKR